MQHHRFFILLLFSFSWAQAAEWHHPLWLGRGNVWRARIPVTITNPSDQPLEGKPVALVVGNGPDDILLAGERAEALRVVDANGVQLLYGLWSPCQAKLSVTGSIPNQAILTLPAVCPPQTSTTYYVYFDNPDAWGVADFLTTPVFRNLNGDFEQGVEGRPTGWLAGHTTSHHRLFWSDERPFQGSKSLKAETDPDAAPSWFGYRREDLPVVPGAIGVIRVRVRGESIKGMAGWYVHVGDADHPQRINQVVSAGEGSFDWREIVITFKTPPHATRIQTGSVLRGVGAAWYDDFRFELDRQPPPVTVRAGSLERLNLNEIGQHADAWPTDPTPTPGWGAQLAIRLRLRDAPAPAIAWQYRLPLRLANLSDEPATDVLAVADLLSIARGRTDPRMLLLFDGQPVETCRLGDSLLFAVSLPPQTLATYYLYVAESDPPSGPAVRTEAVSALGSDIPSDQILVARPRVHDVKAFARLLNSPVNLIQNPDFTAGADLPDGWTHSPPEVGVRYETVASGPLGARHARITVPDEAPPAWRGWRQAVPVRAGRHHLFGAWLASENLRGTASAHAHLRDESGQLIAGGYLTAGPPVSGTTDWTPLFNTVKIPSGARAVFDLHLTMNDHGTLLHDGAFLAESIEAVAADPETRALPPNQLDAWQVDAIIKVFHESAPPASAIGQPAIALARNEEEALQLAIRAGRDLPDFRIQLDAPRGPRGHALDDFSIGWVYKVPIDHRTAYYNLTTPAWTLKFPSHAGASDGWPGWWPDPIVPKHATALQANQTRAAWISFRAAADAPPGRYAGVARLFNGDTLLRRIPFTVTVWDFQLPDRPSLPAIYDLRLNAQWFDQDLPIAEQADRMMRFMAEKKITPDRIPVEPRFFRDADGQIAADFSDYDKAAARYFDIHRFPVSYFPQIFYGFGWAHPPYPFMGEPPYEGDPPHTSADRSQLRPAYKKAYQDALRLYWNHVKARGWADRLVLYISDEPHFNHRPIVEQMKALCRMIHDVAPDIPIFSSSWRHCPEWNGYLTIWGIGQYGGFPVSEMRARRAAGDRLWLTTDGQMCTDTPFCAIERLLPHYCFAYDVEAYEFWGVSWLTYDPWRFGWHRYIQQSCAPGESYFVRYPNGDGYLLYPGPPVGVDGPVTTIRLEAARDGIEDYEYLLLLRNRQDDPEAARLLAAFAELVPIPNAGGRYSSRILPDPSRLAALRMQAGAALERLYPRPAP